jgi:hypothetical protein
MLAELEPLLGTTEPPPPSPPPTIGAGFKFALHVEARNCCPAHPDHISKGVNCEICGEERPLVGVHDNQLDLGTIQLLWLMMNNLLDTAASAVPDTANVSRSLSVNSAATVPQIVAGTGTTAAAVSDYKLQTQATTTSGYVTAVTANPSGSTMVITGTITNTSGGTLAYDEVGIYITVATWVFMLAHDAPLTGGPFNVSNNGTLAVTYTATVS